MTDLKNRPLTTQPGRIWGWLSGLGLIVAPWITSGIISTFTPDPEAAFPWIFLVSFATMAGLIIYGSVKVPGFRRGAIVSCTIALGLVGLLYLALLWLQP